MYPSLLSAEAGFDTAPALSKRKNQPTDMQSIEFGPRSKFLPCSRQLDFTRLESIFFA